MNHLADDISDTRTFIDEKTLEVSGRLTNIELGIGDAPTDWYYVATVWSSLERIEQLASAAVPTTTLNILRNDVLSHETELTNIFNHFENFKTNVENSLRVITNCLGSLAPPPMPAHPAMSHHAVPATAPPAVPFGSSANHPSNTSVVPNQPNGPVITMAMYQSLLADVQTLCNDQANADLKIRSLQTKIHQNEEVSFNLGGNVVRGSEDVKAHLTQNSLRDIDYGGLCDVYNILIRIGTEISGAGSLADYTKHQKDSASINQSEDESIVNYSFQSMAPPMFAGDKSTKSDIEHLKKHTADWKDKGAMSGLGYEIKKRLQGVREIILQTIMVNYSKAPNLLSLANVVYTTACAFITTFISWIDLTYEQLTQGGNSPEDVRLLLSKVIRAFFEEGLGPKRLTPTGTTFTDKGDRAGVVIWGVIKTHLATEAMLRGDFRDHPIVTGNYAKWLVNHSGKKDAQELKKEVVRSSRKKWTRCPSWLLS